MEVHMDCQGNSALPSLNSESSFSFQSTASVYNFKNSDTTVFEKRGLVKQNNDNTPEHDEEVLRESVAGYHINASPGDLMEASVIGMVDQKTMPVNRRNVLLDREKLKENFADYQYKLYQKYSVNLNDLVRLEKLLNVTIGTLTQVFNKRDRRYYALKEIKRQDFQKQSHFETVVYTEIQNLLKIRELDDPSLMKVYYVDFDEEGEICYILLEVGYGRIQEYAQCMTYYGLSWKEEDLEYILSQILAQIFKLKQVGMHHRDIKPRTIVVNYKHEYLKFGSVGCACITEPGVQKLDVAGTLRYMAPELISAIMKKEKVAEYDPYLSDLFSVGMTILTLIEPELKRKNVTEYLENAVKVKYSGLYPILKDLLGAPSQRNKGVQKFLARETRIKSCLEFEAGTVGDKFQVFVYLKIMGENTHVKTSLYFDMCILDHALLVIKKKIDQLAQDKNPEDQNLEEVIWRIRLARCYYMQKNYECALKELLDIIQMKELKSFETENTLVKAKALLWLGAVKEKLGRKTDSIENLMHCLGMRIAEFGEVHKGVAEVFWHLGDIRLSQENLSGARKAFEKCIEIGEQLDTKDRKYMAKGLYSLGTLNGMRNDHGKALELFERGKETAIVVHGEFHPAVADQLLAIGNTYIILGRNEEGQDLYEEALATKIRWYGKNNPEVADTYIKIARGYEKMGEYRKALEFIGKGVIIWRKVKGEESQELADVYQLIGSILCKKGNYSKSLVFADKVIKIKEMHFGKNHPWLASTYIWRTEICSILDLDGEKQKSLEDFLAIDFDKVELNIEDIKIGFRAVGLLAEEGKIEKAREYLQKAYRMCIDIAVDETTKTYSCYYEALGRLKMAEGRYGEAIENIKAALNIRDCLPCKNPDIELGLYNAMGDLYEVIENNQEALKCRRRSIELVERSLSKGGLLMLKTVLNLARILLKIGKRQEVRDKLVSAHQLIEELGLSRYHPLCERYLDIQSNLAGRQI